MLTATTTTDGWRSEVASSLRQGSLAQVSRKDWRRLSFDLLAVGDILQGGGMVFPSGPASCLTEEAGRGWVGEEASKQGEVSLELEQQLRCSTSTLISPAAASPCIGRRGGGRTC